MIDWNIQSRSHTCQSCTKPFADKESYHTLLLNQQTGYERLDVCEACWKNQHSEAAGSRKGFVSHWQGLYQAPPPAAPEPIQQETAETLLRKLAAQNNSAHAAVLFILAVMLERKRLLKVKDQLRQEGRRIFVYEHAQSGDVFTITDPDLQLGQLEQVQRDVAHLMEHGFPAEPTLPAAPQTGEPAPSAALATAPAGEPAASCCA